jgi:putative aldouronate transport system permease protein
MSTGEMNSMRKAAAVSRCYRPDKANDSVSKKAKLKKKLWDQRYLLLLLMPALIWVVLICYAPMAGLYMSFINYTPKGRGFFVDMIQAKFVGLEWFKYFFTTDFLKIMRNTLATSLLTLLFSFPLPILLAVCLNEIRSAKLKKFIQTASYLPYFISWVIVANIFITFLSAGGVINKILMGIGLIQEPIIFFQHGPYFWWIIAAANTWKVLGYNAIIYLASISGINQDMYEAADVDGATRLQKITNITLPALKPTIIIMLILAIGSILNTGFEQQLLMSNDSILDYADVLDTYAYRYGLKNGMYSYGTAVGLFKSVVSFILVMSANRISKRYNDGQALF